MSGRDSILVLCTASFLLWGCRQKAEQQPAPGSAAAGSAEAPAGGAEAHAGAASSEQTALHKADPAGNYGAGIVLQQATSISAILAEPAQYEGKIVQVAGTVSAVCAMRGCWLELASGDAALRVKVTDGEIVFPLSAKGHQAVVEGVVEKIEMSEEQHRAWKQHDAEERGVAFDPASVSGPYTMWRLAGLGARIEG